jgi:lipooligosaccharide transport system permease protein
MTVLVRRPPAPPAIPAALERVWRSRRLVQRNLLVYKHGWMVILSGFFEPLFYLLGIGFGLGSIIPPVELPDGRSVPYEVFVGPALLATAAMNGAVAETIFNIFFKLNYEKTYEAILATPLGIAEIALGELFWALIRAALYAIAFLVVLLAFGLVLSPWAILVPPAAILVSAAFSSAGLAATGYLRKIQDFDIPMGMVVMPMFLFSATFFPLAVYPAALQIVVQLTPLYQAVSLLRSLTTGMIDWHLAVHVAYLVAMIVICMTIAMRRLHRRIIA